jgi:nucleoside-diphosphate-sugar epimerase
MYVVGGHGYVGSRVVAHATVNGSSTVVVSRTGDERRGVASIAWADFLTLIRRNDDPQRPIVWILDGAKHQELERLQDLLAAAGASTYLVMASSCTVYGDRMGQACDEETPLSLVTANARLKASCEDALRGSSGGWGALRLGALYGVDDRGVRPDRVEKWVTEAAQQGVVTVPHPSHWRGWVHRDQAARALYQSAVDRFSGVLNVASANLRFGDAARVVAERFDASVNGDGKEDPMNYQINANRARKLGILDERDGEDLGATVMSFADTYTRRTL